MSNNIFPALPSRKRPLRRRRQWSVSIFTTESQTEQRFVHGATPRPDYQITHNVRESKPAPAPWQAYSELAIVEKFEDDHFGEGDSFLWVCPDGVQRRVRFLGAPIYTEIAPGLHEVEIAFKVVV